MTGGPVWISWLACQAGDGGGTQDSDVTPVETVRVVTYGDEAPLSGVEVLISSADGAEVDTLTTDAAGEIRAQIPEGGSVSILDESFGTGFVRTAYDVPEGGVAVFGSYRLLGVTTPPPGATHTLTASATNSPPSTSTWVFSTRCDGANSSTPGPFVFDNAQCLGHGTDQLQIVGFDGAGDIVAWASAYDVPLDSSVVLALPLTETALAAIDAQIVDLPQGASESSVSFAPFYEDRRMYFDSAHQSGTGDLAAHLEVPADAAEGWRFTANVTLSDNGYLFHVESDAAPTLGARFDAGALAQLLLEAPDLTDPVRPVMRWLGTPGDAGDFGTTRLMYTDGTGDLRYWETRFDAAARLSLALPELPDAWADARPAADLYGDALLFTEQVDFLDGYADAAAWSGVFPAQSEYSGYQDQVPGLFYP